MGAPLVPCIAVSTFYVLLTCALCEILRKIVDAALPNGLAKTALNEAIAGAELCGCGFELIISKFLQKKKKDYLKWWFSWVSVRPGTQKPNWNPQIWTFWYVEIGVNNSEITI